MTTTSINVEGFDLQVIDNAVDWYVLERYSAIVADPDKAVVHLAWLARRLIANWDAVLAQVAEAHGSADIPTCTRLIIRAMAVASGGTSEGDAKN